MSNKLAYNSIAHMLPLFHQPWWLDAVCDQQWDVALIIESKAILAVWPYQFEKKFGFRIIRNPLLCPYLGPLWIGECERPADWLNVLWQQLPAADFAQFACLPEFEEQDFFIAINSDKMEKVTYFLDLAKSETQMWNELHSTRRNGIRKGMADLTLIKSPINLEEFVAWNSIAFANKGKKYPYTISYLKKIVIAAEQRKACVNYCAKDKEGNTVAMLWLAFDHHKMYYLLSATAPDANRGAMALLAWNAILDSKKMGLSIFDFEGSMDAGIARFFQRFGGEKLHYYDFRKTTSSLWKLKQKLLG